MTKDQFGKLLPLKVPAVIAMCPICSDVLFIEGIDEWVEDGDQMRLDPEWQDVNVNCATEPDIDSEELEDWMSGHWSMPYVDWMPVSKRVTKWLSEELEKPDCLKQLLKLAGVSA